MKPPASSVEGSADVKYFIWVKTEECPTCQTVNDLCSPDTCWLETAGTPEHVVACSECGCLNEVRRRAVQGHANTVRRM